MIKEYKDFTNTIERNWLVAYYNYFEKTHPKDTQRYTESNPYPKTINYDFNRLQNMNTRAEKKVFMLLSPLTLKIES